MGWAVVTLRKRSAEAFWTGRGHRVRNRAGRRSCKQAPCCASDGSDRMHLLACPLRHLLLVTAFITLVASSVPAQDPATTRPEATREKPEETFPRVEWRDHPSLRLGPGTRIDFRARFQWDVRRSDAPFGDDEDEASGAVDFARRRLGVAGEILDIIDYQVERELESPDAWRDVYANYKQFDAVQVQAGKFKLPFSLDEDTSATDLDFVYRSRAAEALARFRRGRGGDNR